MSYLNRNFLAEDGVIHNVFIGDQNAETVKKTGSELEKLGNKVRGSGGRVLILTDLSKIGKVSLSARVAGLELMKNLDFHKAAIFGNYNQFIGIVSAISQAAGRSFKVKIFNTEKEAREWLLIEYV